MATNFEKRVTGKLPAQTREALALLDSEIGSLAYIPQKGEYQDPAPWTFEAEEGTTTGISAVEVWDEATEHGLQPRRLWSIFSAAPAGSEPNDRVKIHTNFDFFWDELRIIVSGTNRIAVDGTAARLQRLVEQLDKPLPAASPSTATASPPLPPAGNGTAVVTIETQNNPASSPSEVSSRSWLQKTWKDHTATLIVTVIGTVVAAVVLVWFGLSA